MSASPPPRRPRVARENDRIAAELRPLPEDRLIEATERLCKAGCRHWQKVCWHGLLAFTSSLEDCPYYAPQSAGSAQDSLPA